MLIRYRCAQRRGYITPRLIHRWMRATGLSKTSTTRPGRGSDGLLCGVALACGKTFRPDHWTRKRSAMPTPLCSLLGLPLALAFWLFADRTGLLASATPSAGPVPRLGLARCWKMFAGAGRKRHRRRSCRARAGWLAAISYSLYLVHKAMYHVVRAPGRTVAGHRRVCLCGLWCNGYCGRCRAALSHRTAVPAMAWPVCRPP